MAAHQTMTLWALGERFPHKQHSGVCPSADRSKKCAGRTVGTAFKVNGKWVCASCARKAAMAMEADHGSN